jgi:hypothetical protein
LRAQRRTYRCHPREGGDPVRRGFPVQSLTSPGYWITRPSAQSRTRRVTTVEYVFAFSPHHLCEVCWRTSHPLIQRAQRRPGACCTRGLVCRLRFGKRCTRAYRYSGSIPAFPAQWLYSLLRALPGERLFCLRYPREASLLQDVMPAPRHQNHTTSPYARAAHVSRSSRVHRIPPHVRDVRERLSSAVRRTELCR